MENSMMCRRGFSIWNYKRYVRRIPLLVCLVFFVWRANSFSGMLRMPKFIHVFKIPPLWSNYFHRRDGYEIIIMCRMANDGIYFPLSLRWMENIFLNSHDNRDGKKNKKISPSVLPTSTTKMYLRATSYGVNR